MTRSALLWLFRNRQTNEITIAQFPNAPLWIFFGSIAVSWIVPDDSTAHTVVAWVGTAALAWWAVDEVLRGVNPWRRLLGVGGCIFAVARVVSLL